jgi:hypothetical protein
VCNHSCKQTDQRGTCVRHTTARHGCGNHRCVQDRDERGLGKVWRGVDRLCECKRANDPCVVAVNRWYNVLLDLVCDDGVNLGGAARQ